MTKKDMFDEFLTILNQWASKGEKTLANGARLICPNPSIAPEAWLHVVFAPLNLEAIQKLKQETSIPLPEDFCQFLLCSNGVTIFGYQIDIYGVRKSYVRTGDDAWQPFDILHLNEQTMKPAGSPNTVVYFGTMDNGESWCFFEPASNGYRVGKTPRERFKPIQYWEDFWSWLMSETYRLASLNKDK